MRRDCDMLRGADVGMWFIGVVMAVLLCAILVMAASEVAPPKKVPPSVVAGTNIVLNPADNNIYLVPMTKEEYKNWKAIR